jgi:hypothetical protein
MIACIALTGFAQTDTTGKNDTIRVGGMIIIRKAGKNTDDSDKGREIKIPRRDGEKTGKVSTNWWIVDLGFSNYDDQTDYASSAAQAIAPGSNEDWFKLKTGKSRNVNLWFFMQRLSIIERVVNLKYGLGLELNNYHFDKTDIVFQKNPTLISTGSKNFKKVKLAADYLTVPLMLNFNFTPDRKNGFGFSGGVSGGLLYSARYKTKENGDKDKIKDDFDLKRWKLSYVGELLLGHVKLYGSYSPKNMWDKGLDMAPYTVGFRLSNW